MDYPNLDGRLGPQLLTVRKVVFIVAGLGVSVAACVWIARQTDLSHALQQIGRLGWGTTLGILSVFGLGFYFRALRSVMMMAPAGVVASRWTASNAIILGCAANNLLPLRLGEVVRTLYTASKTGCPKATALACVAAERLTDLCMLVLVLLGVIASFYVSIGEPPTAVKALAVPAGLLLSGIVVSFALTVPLRALLQRHQARLPRKAVRLADRLLEAVLFLRDPKRLVRVGALSLLVWLCEGGLYAGTAWSLGLPHPVLAGYLTLAVVNLSILVPSSPGFVGVFHAAAVFALSTLGVDSGPALAMGIVCHGLPFLSITAAGLLIFLRDTAVILGLRGQSLAGDA